jgi:hypothetical protein
MYAGQRKKPAPSSRVRRGAVSDYSALNPEALIQLRRQAERLKRFLENYEYSMLEDYPVSWSDEQALKSINGSALSDDPPKGWGKAKLAQFARGRAYGEQVLAGNAIQFAEFILDILDHPEKWTDEAIAARWGLTVDQMRSGSDDAQAAPGDV